MRSRLKEHSVIAAMLEGGLAALVLLLLCSAGQGEPVSMWDFNDPAQPDAGHNNEIPVVDQIGPNDGWVNGGLSSESPYEGAGAMTTTGSGANGFYPDSLTGISKVAGTFMFAYKTNGYPWSEWGGLISTHLFENGGDPDSGPLRVHLWDASNHYIKFGSGPETETETVDWTGLLDGDWHTVAVSYADGDIVRLYVDGGLFTGTTGIYHAEDYSLRDMFFLGNVGGANVFHGFYDYLIYFDTQLSDDEVKWYHDNGYFAPPTQCGDPTTTYLQGDFDKDCRVTWEDVAVFAGMWMCEGDCGITIIDSDDITAVWDRSYYMSEGEGRLFIETGAAAGAGAGLRCQLRQEDDDTVLQESVVVLDGSGAAVATFDLAGLAEGRYEAILEPGENVYFVSVKAPKVLRKLAHRSYAVQYNERGSLMRGGVPIFPVAMYYIQPYWGELIFEYSTAGFNTHNLEWGNASSYIQDSMLQAIYGVRPMVGL